MSKVNNWCLSAEGLTRQQLKSLFIAAMEAGADVEDYYPRIGGDYHYLGVDENDNTYCSDSISSFGAGAMMLDDYDEAMQYLSSGVIKDSAPTEQKEPIASPYLSKELLMNIITTSGISNSVISDAIDVYANGTKCNNVSAFSADFDVNSLTTSKQ